MFGVFCPLFILPKGEQHGSFSISLFTQLYGLNFLKKFRSMEHFRKSTGKRYEELKQQRIKAK